MFEPSSGFKLPETPPLVEEVPIGPVELPADDEDTGPPNGLTLDAAIERLVHENLDLRTQFHEIPKAQADVLTAGLRANPLFYADAQLIPYGSYNVVHPSGPVQYDVNISHPFDLSHKRKARTAVACHAKRILEAQYQDAVLKQIDALYTTYVGILAARETIRYARAHLDGLTQTLKQTDDMQKAGEKSPRDVARLRIQLQAASIGVSDAEEAFLDSKRPMAVLLQIPVAQAEALDLRGSISDRGSLPPVGDNLLRIAFENRPDLSATRIGLGLAEADVKLAKAERFEDVYVLYQPYTFTPPFNGKPSTSWALGVTVPMPIYNRNQGNIARAKVNVSQTRHLIASVESKIATEVRHAEREYLVTRNAVERIERELLPAARAARDDVLKGYHTGEVDISDYFDAQRSYNETVRQYRDSMVRHRRSMLSLNTAVGYRILP